MCDCITKVCLTLKVQVYTFLALTNRHSGESRELLSRSEFNNNNNNNKLILIMILIVILIVLWKHIPVIIQMQIL